MNNTHNLKLVFFRATNLLSTIGVTDWRIGLFLPEFGFEIWIYGISQLAPDQKCGVHFVQINLPRLPYIATLISSFIYAFKAAKVKPDVLVCNPGLALAAIIHKFLHPRVKVILDVRTIPVETDGLNGLIHAAYFDLIMRLKFYDALSTITQGMLVELDNKYKFIRSLPTNVWGSGFDHELFVPCSDVYLHTQISKPKIGQILIMYHGSFSNHRGLFEAVKAMRLLKDSNAEDVSLVLVGKGPARDELQKLVSKLSIDDYVSILPAVPIHELPDLISSASLGIDLLPDHPWWRNQSSMKVYEYLAMGKPVLATDLPCHRGLSEGILLIPDNSPETIANAILEYRNLPPERKAYLQAAALRDVKNHTWRARARTFADFIKQEVLEPQAYRDA